MTDGPSEIVAPVDESDFPDVRDLRMRHGDLAPDGAVSTGALARLFEHPRVMLSLPRFERLAGSGEFGPFRILLVGQRVERHVALGEVDVRLHVGTGIRRIGRSSFSYGQALFAGRTHVASGRATVVLADGDGPKALPDALQADLRELLLPGTEPSGPATSHGSPRCCPGALSRRVSEPRRTPPDWDELGHPVAPSDS